jgi:tetratricopeptide (TPR) repeat protein
MKPFTILFLSILASAGTAFLVVTVSGPSATRAEAPRADTSDAHDTLARSVAALTERNAQLEKTLEELRKDFAAQGGSTRVPTGEIEAAVARALEARGAPATASSKPSPAPAAKKGDAKSFYDKLKATNMDWEDGERIWREAEEAGVTKELAAMFEQRAKDNPNDPEAHVELGQALLQQIKKFGDSPEAGIYATRADQAFDRALELDDHNWTARFTKAVSLTFWPSFMGKGSEAISNFETLVKQQDEVAPLPHHAETHVMLGNMYANQGKKEQAIAAYKKGLSIFPDNAHLKKQLALVQPN